MNRDFTYDVFLSYSSKDKAAVHALAERLRDDGLAVWLDHWAIGPGAPISLEIQRGLEASAVLLMCMSKAYFASDWTTLEHQTLLFRDPTNRDRRFIPVMLEDVDPPDVIAQFAHIDWRDGGEDGYQRIVTACQPPVATGEVSPRRETEADVEEADIGPIATLEGHDDSVWCVAITPDGRRAVSGAADDTVKIWDLEQQTLTAILEGHSGTVMGVAITPDGRRAVSSSGDNTLKIWDLDQQALIATLEGHDGSVWCVAVTPDGRRLVSGSDDKTIKIWDLEQHALIATLEVNSATVMSVAISADGRRAVSGSDDETIKIWDLEQQALIATLEGHSSTVLGVAISADGRRAVSGSDDETIKIWDLEQQALIATLEGHSGTVMGIAIIADGRRLVSGSDDGTLKIWDLEQHALIATFDGHDEAFWCVAISADGRRLVSGSYDGSLKIWDLTTLDTAIPLSETARYTNAKVVLVGESGAGKSGLALRLAGEDWRETGSTHGLSVSRLEMPPIAGAAAMEREAWLWDFAGQPDYRLIHQLFMDETALALMVVDPQKDQPFEPLGHWEQALARAVKREPAKILVAARCDRGGFTIGRREIEDYMAARDYAGHVDTAAKLPDDPGCAELGDLIAQYIPWDSLPSTSTSRIFKALKDAVIEVANQDIVLIRVAELEQRLRLGWMGEAFGDGDVRTVIGLLAGQGLVQPLSFGDFVLLQPELVNNYGSAVVRAARESANELAEIPEQTVLDGDIDFKDMPRLDQADEKILLRAMLQTFLDRGLCYKIDTSEGAKLVFPAYFKHNRPTIPEQPNIVVTYGFTGPVDEIYTTLVVRLHYSHEFVSDRLWRYAADFNVFTGGRAGLLLTKQRDEAAKIQVYFDEGAALNDKVLFIKYVHEHLKRQAEDVTRVRDYVCPHCDTPVENKIAIAKRIELGHTDIICGVCEERVTLQDLIEEKFASDAFLRDVRRMDSEAQIRLDNESLELVLVGHAMSITGEAGHIFRPTPNSDWGIDGEIEFKNDKGKASGKRLYLQLKSGGSYLRKRKRDSAEVFDIKDPRQAEYWQSHEYPVMLVIRGSDEKIRWMNVTDYLRQHGTGTKQIIFDGEPFTAVNIHNIWRRLVPVVS